MEENKKERQRKIRGVWGEETSEERKKKRREGDMGARERGGNKGTERESDFSGPVWISFRG